MHKHAIDLPVGAVQALGLRGRRGQHREGLADTSELACERRVGVDPDGAAEERGQHLLDAEGVDRDVSHGHPSLVARHPGHAVGAVLDDDRTGLVGALDERSRRRVVDDAVGMLEHDGARVLPEAELVGIERARPLRKLAVNGNEPRGDDGVDRRAAGEQLRHDLSCALLSGERAENGQHAVACAIGQVPVLGAGLGELGHALGEGLLQLASFHGFPFRVRRRDA